jgi:acyl-CoA hydrolase
MVAINSALEIDLSGQCCAESIGASVTTAGTGGHKEFGQGTQLFPGGKSIIAFLSDRPQRYIPTSVPSCSPAPWSPLRASMWIMWSPSTALPVYGAARVGSGSRKLINIAHPNFRDWCAAKPSEYDVG